MPLRVGVPGNWIAQQSGNGDEISDRATEQNTHH